MPIEIPFTLAAIEDFIVPIIAVAMVISGIINSSREAKKAKDARARKRRSSGSSSTSGSGDIQRDIGADTSNSNLPTLEQIAEQRRRQLDSLSRKRMGTARQSPDQSAKDAMAAERAAAKKEYEARAEAMRREKAEAAAQSRAQERRRQQAEELRRQQEQQQRERAARAQRKRQQQQAKPQRSLQSLGSGQHDSIVSGNLGHGATDVEDTHTGFGTVHRHVKDAPALPAVQIGHASEIRALVKGHALRNAILLKEVLDRPLALRDDNEHSDPFDF